MWNVANERELLTRWFQHMREARCAVYVTYNGDFFDWPFMETRAAACGMDMKAELGFSCGKKSGECLSRCEACCMVAHGQGACCSLDAVCGLPQMAWMWLEHVSACQAQSLSAMAGQIAAALGRTRHALVPAQMNAAWHAACAA